MQRYYVHKWRAVSLQWVVWGGIFIYSLVKWTMKHCSFNSIISWFKSVINIKMGTRSEFQDWHFCTSFLCNWEGFKTVCVWVMLYWRSFTFLLVTTLLLWLVGCLHSCLLSCLLLSSESMHSFIPLLQSQNVVAVVMLPAVTVTQGTECFSMNDVEKIWYLQRNVVTVTGVRRWTLRVTTAGTQGVPCVGHMNVSTVECRHTDAIKILWKLHLQVMCFRFQC